MAAELLAERFGQWGIDAVVTSAGTHAGIVESDPDAIAAMAERGIDISSHRPRLVDRALIAADGADLVVAMTRAHLREIASRGPRVFKRGFTMKELARRCVALQRLPEEGEADIAGWCTALGADRKARDLLGNSLFDDIADPYGLSVANHRQTAGELDALASVVAMSLSGWLSSAPPGQ